MNAMSTDVHYEVEGLRLVVMLNHALGCDLDM